MWFLILAVSIFLSVGAAIIQKIILKDKNVDSTAYAIFYQLLTGLLLLIYALISGISFNGFLDNWMNIALLTIFYGIGNVLVSKVVQQIDISEYTIIFQANALFTVVFSSIILGESLNSYQFVGFFLILLGILVTLYDHKFVLHKYHILTIIAAGILALAFINDAFLIKKVNIPTYLSLAFIIPGAITLLFYPRAIRSFKVLTSRKNIYYLILIALFTAFGAVLFFISYGIINNAARISSVAKISTVLIVLAGILFLGERRKILQKISGSILALVGVYFLL